MAVVPDVDASGQPETPANQMAEKKKQKNLTVLALALGGIGVAVTVFLKKRSAASTTATGSSGYSYPTLASGTSQYPALGDTLTTLQNQIAALSSATSPVTTPAPNPYAGNKIVGAGYLTPADPGYSWLPSWTSFATAFGSGQQVYYEPAAGVYAPVSAQMAKDMGTPGSAVANTPTYLARSSQWAVTSASGTGPTAVPQ